MNTSLPDFIGIGAQKAGTTFLYDMIRQHPDICMASGRKEVHYFDRYYDRGEEWYRSLFQQCDGKLRGECTPAYVFQKPCAERIHALVPHAKLLLVLRNPVARCYSQYKFTIREKGYAKPFREFLDEDEYAIDRGYYFQQIERYLKYFPREQIMILLFEQLTAQPQEQCRRVFEFLGIDPTFTPRLESINTNESELPRLHGLYTFAKKIASTLRDYDLYWIIEGVKKLGGRRVFFSGNDKKQIEFPKLSAEDRAYLQSLYRNDVEQLSSFLETDLITLWGFPAKG